MKRMLMIVSFCLSSVLVNSCVGSCTSAVDQLIEYKRQYDDLKSQYDQLKADYELVKAERDKYKRDLLSVLDCERHPDSSLCKSKQ